MRQTFEGYTTVYYAMLEYDTVNYNRLVCALNICSDSWTEVGWSP